MAAVATATQLFCEAANVGKRVKGSKRMITWRFKFHDTERTHVIELKHSVMTGKREIFVDKRSIHESRSVVKKIDFVENFHIERHLARVTIKEHFDRYAYSALSPTLRSIDVRLWLAAPVSRLPAPPFGEAFAQERYGLSF